MYHQLAICSSEKVSSCQESLLFFLIGSPSSGVLLNKEIGSLMLLREAQTSEQENERKILTSRRVAAGVSIASFRRPRRGSGACACRRGSAATSPRRRCRRPRGRGSARSEHRSAPTLHEYLPSQDRAFPTSNLFQNNNFVGDRF